MKRYFSILSAIIKQSFMNALEYKVNFFIGGLFELMWMIAYIIFINVIFGHVSSVAGWSKDAMMLLVFYGGLNDAVFTFLFAPSLWELPALIGNGALDFYLLKPVNKRFFLSCHKVSMPQVLNIIISLGLIVWKLSSMRMGYDIKIVAGFLVMFLSGFILIYSIVLLLMTLSFWVIRMDVVESTCQELLTIGNKPKSIFPKLIGKVFTYIIPIFVALNAPVEYILRMSSPAVIVVSVLMSGTFYVLSSMFLRHGLNAYSSVNGGV